MNQKRVCVCVDSTRSRGRSGRISDEMLSDAHSSHGSKIPRTRRRDFGNGANRYYYANNALSDVMATFSRGRPAEARNERNYVRNAQFGW